MPPAPPPHSLLSCCCCCCCCAGHIIVRGGRLLIYPRLLEFRLFLVYFFFRETAHTNNNIYRLAIYIHTQKYLIDCPSSVLCVLLVPPLTSRRPSRSRPNSLNIFSGGENKNEINWLSSASAIETWLTLIQVEINHFSFFLYVVSSWNLLFCL